MEEYVGVKFKVEFLRKEIPSDPRIEQLSYWCRKFHSSGLTPVINGKSMGNLSFRLREGVEEFITTASGLGPKESLGAECFVKVIGCDLGRKIVYASGLREPSSESILHCRIYEIREDVNAIFHGHNSAITKQADKLGLAQTKEWHPYGSIELVKAVEEVLDKNDFIVMTDHGFISLGRGGKAMEMAGLLALQKKEMLE
ncbi:MAG: class II aldolase/adducin family protein [Dehalococcoidia bacterium]